MKVKESEYQRYLKQKDINDKKFKVLLKKKIKLDVVKLMLKDKNVFEGSIRGMDYKIYREFINGTYILELEIIRKVLPFDLPDYSKIASFLGCENKNKKDSVIFIKKYDGYENIRLPYLFNKNASNKSLSQFKLITLNMVKKDAETIRDKTLELFELLIFLNDNIRKETFENYFNNIAKKGGMNAVKNLISNKHI